MRVILDTNVLVSALINPKARPYKLVEAWLDGRFELVSSAAQLEELVRVSRYPTVRKFIEITEVGWLINRVKEHATIIKRLPKIDVSSDPADNYLFAMAVAGKVDYLVAGDKAGVLSIKRHGKTQIVTVREMVAKLKLK